MIAFVKGIVETIDENYVIIDSGNIGYKVFMSPFSLSALKMGEEVKIHTFLKVAEDLFDLYGFLSQDELKMFKMIISVSGAGPKAGLAILSVMRPSEFALAVVTDDFKAITKAQGVGPKLAQKIALELKDKLKNEDLLPKETESISAVSIGATSKSQNDAIDALCVLGYTQAEAMRAISQVDKSLSVEDTIKEALKILALR